MRSILAAASAVVLAVGLLFGLGTAVPRVAVACSCIGPQPIATYAGPDNVIFAGQVLGEAAGGVRFGVEQWFSGTEPGPVVQIAGDFGNGASCGIGFVPAEGSEWIAVAWRPTDDGPLGELTANENLQVSICQPFLDLATPAGQALHAEAVAAFGEGTIEGEPPPPTPAPEAPATPAPTTTADPAAAGPDPETTALMAVGGVIVLGVGVLGLAALVARRRPPAEPGAGPG